MSDSDDNEVLTSGSLPMAASVTVKPPPFDETSVTRWFTIVESQFVLAKITVASIKFHHILSNLPLRVINQVSDEVIQSQQLKRALISLFTKSKPELFDSLVNQNNILCDKPSNYLRELRKVTTQLGVDDSFIKLKFLKALPGNIRLLLVTYEDGTSLEELAGVAETLLAYGSNNFGASSQPNVSMVESRQGCRSITRNGENFRGSSSTSAASVFSKTVIPIGVRSFHGGQRPQVCRYHLHYGNKAKSCKRWCILSSSCNAPRPGSRSSSSSRITKPSEN